MNPNMQAWLDNLATTTEKQGTGYLVTKAEDGTLAYCCLGLGCKQAGLTDALHIGDVEDDYCAPSTSQGLAPWEFLEWLGTEPANPGYSGGEYDLFIDVPPGLTEQGIEGEQYVTRPTLTLTAAGLNDDGFTFKQIADVIRYFGIKEV